MTLGAKLGTGRRNATYDRSGPLHFDGENHGPQYGIESQFLDEIFHSHAFLRYCSP